MIMGQRKTGSHGGLASKRRSLIVENAPELQNNIALLS